MKIDKARTRVALLHSCTWAELHLAHFKVAAHMAVRWRDEGSPVGIEIARAWAAQSRAALDKYMARKADEVR